MRRTLALLGLSLLICGSLAAQTRQARKSTSGGGSHTQSDLKTVYQKWLDEDVAYIITAQEARAFVSLKTDAEREQFIEAFWMRRDLKPETVENEYRAEHYERIAHANQSFGFKGLAGWRTDRGRIYIMYGKPDEVRTSASKEVWVYKYVQGIGSSIEIEFVDATGAGELRLSKPIP